MKKKFALLNLILMLVVLFISSYQTIHIVQHAHHHDATPKHFSGFHQYEQLEEDHIYSDSKTGAVFLL